MVSRTPYRPGRHNARGFLMIELIVAISILVLAVFPLALSFLGDQKLSRAYYHRALAMEIVDGEMEALAAGGWRSFSPGAHPYATRAVSATNLPPGQFMLTVKDDRVRLEWVPVRRNTGGGFVREVKVR